MSSSLVDEVLALLSHDAVSHGWIAQTVAEGTNLDVPLREQITTLLTTLLDSGLVDVGTLREASHDRLEFVAWSGSTQARVSKALDNADQACDADKEFAYWLCLRQNVDRFE